MPTRAPFLVVPGLLLSLAPAGRLVAQDSLPCPPAPSLEGSVWEGQTSLKDREAYEFLRNGTLAYTTPNGRFTSATWKQNGECVTIDINEGYVLFTGRFTGDKLNGEFVQRFGMKWTVAATRRQTGGESGPGREWESLRTRSKEEYGRGRFAEAARTAERALKSAERAFGPTDDRLVLTLKELALMLQTNHKNAEALPHAQRALRIVEQSHGRESREYGEALNTLGKSYTGLEKYVEAEDVFRQGLAISEKLYGPEDPLVAMLLNNMGNLLTDQDRYEEAEPLLERSLKLLDTDKADPNTLAPALNNLAVAKKELGKLDEAMMLYERSVGVMERLGGEEHKMLIPVLQNLAILYKEKGWTDEAAETQARIKRIQSRPE
jgi:tetratricopeptide (TPR) repeat protein